VFIWNIAEADVKVHKTPVLECKR